MLIQAGHKYITRDGEVTARVEDSTPGRGRGPAGFNFLVTMPNNMRFYVTNDGHYFTALQRRGGVLGDHPRDLVEELHAEDPMVDPANPMAEHIPAMGAVAGKIDRKYIIFYASRMENEPAFVVRDTEVAARKKAKALKEDGYFYDVHMVEFDLNLHR